MSTDVEVVTTTREDFTEINSFVWSVGKQMTKQRELAQLFARGIHKTKSSNLIIDNDHIYSYGKHWPIAKIYDRENKLAVINSQKRSGITTWHTEIVKQVLLENGYTIEESKRDNNIFVFKDEQKLSEFYRYLVRIRHWNYTSTSTNSYY